MKLFKFNLSVFFILVLFSFYIVLQFSGISKLDIDTNKISSKIESKINKLVSLTIEKLENGLSNNTVLCSIQNKMGFIWFGTRDGLNRFDGNQFKNFMYDPEDPNSLINNFITALAEDNEGHIVIGKRDGICSFNHLNETF